MALAAPSKFHGLITITSGSNDKIDWYEEDGDGHSDNLNTTIPAAAYYPGTDSEAGTLAKLIKDYMETASDAGAIGVAHGTGLNYAVSIDNSTGLITITASGGTVPKWYPKIKTTETHKLLTGSDAAAGSRGRHHFGWNVDSAYPSAATSHTSDVAHANSFYPGQTPSRDDEGVAESLIGEAISIDGHQDVADYVGDEDGIVIREVEFQFVLTAARAWYIDEFWRAYAKAGGRFRFYKNGTSASYTIYTLTGKSLSGGSFRERRSGYPYWTDTLLMLEYRS